MSRHNRATNNGVHASTKRRKRNTWWESRKQAAATTHTVHVRSESRGSPELGTRFHLEADASGPRRRRGKEGRPPAERKFRRKSAECFQERHEMKQTMAIIFGRDHCTAAQMIGSVMYMVTFYGMTLCPQTSWGHQWTSEPVDNHRVSYKDLCSQQQPVCGRIRRLARSATKRRLGGSRSSTGKLPIWGHCVL